MANLGTKIEWTDATWSPVVGCTKVSPGCKNCYAEVLAKRFAGRNGFPRFVPWTVAAQGEARANGVADEPVTLHPDRLEAPLHWRKPRRVFVNSMSDLCHEAVPDEFIGRVFAVMALARQHTFQVLTKRPERMLAALTRGRFPRDVQDRAEALHLRGFGPTEWLFDWPLPNLWLGVSCENQRYADERIPILAQVPAAVRFVSCEPLLERLDLSSFLKYCLICHEPISHRAFHHSGASNHPWRPVDWVIVGGESGPEARPCNVEWIRDIVRQCREAGVPVFVKQLGSQAVSAVKADHLGRIQKGSEMGTASVAPEPWRLWLNDPKGGDPQEWPEDLRVREWPR